MLNRTTAITIAFLIAPLLVGCNQPVAENPPNDNSEGVVDSSAGDASAPQVDIATQPNTLPEKDATAKQVCERFLGLLAQGERSLAEQLLTRRALKVTIDAGLELEAVGGPESTVEIEDAMYATSRGKVAQVPCTVTEKDGKKQSLLWMMRRSDSGWRIAGLIVDTGKSQEFLSLENKADVAAIMGAKGVSPEPSKVIPATDASEAAVIRQVSATDEE